MAGSCRCLLVFTSGSLKSFPRGVEPPGFSDPLGWGRPVTFKAIQGGSFKQDPEKCVNQE